METEKKRYDDDAVFGSCFIHCIVTIVGAWYCSAWWIMALYIIEVLILIYVAIHEPKAKRKKRGVKPLAEMQAVPLVST